MKILIVLALSAIAWGQDGTPMNSSQGSPYVGYQTIAYNVAGLTSYVCSAKSNLVSTITVSAASNANPVSFTATAHNIGDYDNLGATVTPIVKITGATGVNWAGINGTWAATITSANAFTIPLNSTTWGALTGTLVVTTMSPRLNVAQWSVYKIFYDSGGYFSGKGWAQLPGGAGATALKGSASGYSFACSARSLLAFE